MSWLVRDTEVLASLEEATTFSARAKGLIGRESHDGVLLLRGTRSVHTFGMRFPIDVAWLCDDDDAYRVVRVARLAPRRLTRPVFSSRHVLEAEAGCFAHWGLEVGDVVEVR